MRPQPAEYPEYFGLYINQVREDDLQQAFAVQQSIFPGFLESIAEEKWDYAYAEGKWTIKELVQHIIDAERVFAYRALCFSRKDKTSLPSFDENSYADNSSANRRNKQDLIDEYISVRDSTVKLFQSFDEEMLKEIGVANNKATSVLSLAFIAVGHVIHHKRVLEEKYLNNV